MSYILFYEEFVTLANLRIKENMKKLIMSLLVLVSMNSFALNYQDIAKENNKIKQFETVNGVELGKPADEKQIKALKLYLAKTDPDSKITFYKDVAYKPFFDIKITGLTYVVKDAKFVSSIIEFEGEDNFKTLEKNLTKKLGKPLLVTQTNEHITYAWGITYMNSGVKKLVRPLVLNFDIYEQVGVAIWTDPKIEFEQSNQPLKK
jgi:hypothetical protein